MSTQYPTRWARVSRFGLRGARAAVRTPRSLNAAVVRTDDSGYRDSDKPDRPPHLAHAPIGRSQTLLSCPPGEDMSCSWDVAGTWKRTADQLKNRSPHWVRCFSCSPPLPPLSSPPARRR